jgi:hypothetical protein
MLPVMGIPGDFFKAGTERKNNTLGRIVPLDMYGFVFIFLFRIIFPAICLKRNIPVEKMEKTLRG